MVVSIANTEVHCCAVFPTCPLADPDVAHVEAVEGHLPDANASNSLGGVRLDHSRHATCKKNSLHAENTELLNNSTKIRTPHVPL